MVIMRRAAWWGWTPMAFDLFVTVILVTIYGGAESKMIVRVLCSVPCLFANIFLFIDSPYKRRGARRLSQRLAVRNAVTLVALPALAVAGGACPREMHGDWAAHQTVIAGAHARGALVGSVVYWFLLWWIASP